MAIKLAPTLCDERCDQAPAYQRHHRRGEEACQRSKDAYAAYMRALRGGVRIRELVDHLSGMNVSDCIDEIARVLHGPHAV